MNDDMLRRFVTRSVSDARRWPMRNDPLLERLVFGRASLEQ
jgi:hypothetical protein